MSAKKGAPKGKSGKRPKSGKGKKEEVEDAFIIQLKRTTEELKQQNAELKDNVTYYRDKLHAVVQHVLDVNIDGYKPTKGIALVDVPESDVMTLITNLTITPNSSLRAYELRLEELETRITQLSTELAKLIRMKLKVENGLKDMERMYTVEDLRVQGKRLWYECCSTHIFATPPKSIQDSLTPAGMITPATSTSDLTLRPQSAMSMTSGFSDASSMQQVQEPEIPPLYLNVLNPRARSINLTPRGSDDLDLEVPEKKLPGDTHIFDMHPGLRSIIIRQLSKRKGSANDWRMIAHRVGIPEGLIEQWQRMRAPNAMALVMKVWGDSVGATVRMLHRHLVSPQMKSVVLAKRVSDFYDVD